MSYKKAASIVHMADGAESLWRYVDKSRYPISKMLQRYIEGRLRLTLPLSHNIAQLVITQN